MNGHRNGGGSPYRENGMGIFSGKTPGRPLTPDYTRRDPPLLCNSIVNPLKILEFNGASQASVVYLRQANPPFQPVFTTITTQYFSQLFPQLSQVLGETTKDISKKWSTCIRRNPQIQPNWGSYFRKESCAGDSFTLSTPGSCDFHTAMPPTGSTQGEIFLLHTDQQIEWIIKYGRKVVASPGTGKHRSCQIPGTEIAS